MRVPLTMMLAVLLAAGLTVLPAGADEIADTISVVKEGEELTNADLAVRLSAEAFDVAPRAIIARDDLFADALASGVLQSRAPLLLVPSDGPVPDVVRAQLEGLGVREIVILGDESAVSARVEDELSSSYAIQRRRGPTRIETAIDIAANDAPDATTAILARAYADPGAGDPTQEFADALAAGALAAELGYPVLLTQTEVLSRTTQAYLESSAITEVLIVGGTAAISGTVEDQLRQLSLSTDRLAGAERASTALEVAAKTGAESAADVERVTLVDSQAPDAWAGGFAAAAHAAVHDAPIVLAAGSDVPAATRAWLGGDGQAIDYDPETGSAVLLCVTQPGVCEVGRQSMGLPPAATVAFDPAPGSTVPGGQRVDITITSESYEVTAALANGSCVGDVSQPLSVVDGRTSVILDDAIEVGPCNLILNFQLPNRASQQSEVVYQGSGAAPEPTGPPTSFQMTFDGTSPLGSGDVLRVGFDQPVAPVAGDTIGIIDMQGDEVELTCGTNATCEAGGQGTASQGLDLTITVTDAPVRRIPRSDGLIDTSAGAVVLDSSIGNSIGDWDLAGSGMPTAVRVFGPANASNALLPPAPDPADVSASAATNEVVVHDADCSPLAQFAGLRVHAQDGTRIAIGDVGREPTACAARVTSTRDLLDGDVVRILYRVPGPYVPSRTLEHTVGTRQPPPPPAAAAAAPISTDIDLLSDSDGVLGPGDEIRLTFTDVVSAPAGTGLRVGDHQGDQARVICGEHAACTVDGAQLRMVLTTSPQTTLTVSDGVVQVSTFVSVVGSSIANDFGNHRIVQSGLPGNERVFGTTDPTNDVLIPAIPVSDVTIDTAANTVTVTDADCDPMAAYDTVRLYDARDFTIIGGSSMMVAGGGCEVVLDASPGGPGTEAADGIDPGEVMYLVTFRATTALHSRTTQITAP